MGKVIPIGALKDQKAVKRGFREWRKRFPSIPVLDASTCFADLPDGVILFLAEDHENSRRLMYDLIMGACELGSGYEFEALPADKLMPLLDIYFILIDQVRFECMRRLGWIEEISMGEKSIIQTIKDAGQGLHPALLKLPMITSKHPAYEDLFKGQEMDHRALIRKYIPDAVKQFKRKIEDEPA